MSVKVVFNVLWVYWIIVLELYGKVGDLYVINELKFRWFNYGIFLSNKFLYFCLYK